MSTVTGFARKRVHLAYSRPGPRDHIKKNRDLDLAPVGPVGPQRASCDPTLRLKPGDTIKYRAARDFTRRSVRQTAWKHLVLDTPL